jgi:hypothetical protein
MPDPLRNVTNEPRLGFVAEEAAFNPACQEGEGVELPLRPTINAGDKLPNEYCVSVLSSVLPRMGVVRWRAALSIPR